MIWEIAKGEMYDLLPKTGIQFCVGGTSGVICEYMSQVGRGRNGFRGH